MAFLDAILNSELFSYAIATILITIAVWLFAGLYSCSTCPNNDPKSDKDKATTAKTWFKLLLGVACAACSAILVYRNLSSPSALSGSSTGSSLVEPRPSSFKTGGGSIDSDSEEIDSFN